MAFLTGTRAALHPHPPAPQLRSGERIKLIPLLCIVCTSVVWGFALFFFFQGLSTWQVSSHPAEKVGSRPQARCEPTNGQFSFQTPFVSTC